MQYLFVLGIILLTFGINDASGEACDPNSSAPILSFSIRQDMATSRVTYEALPLRCKITADQFPRMNFKVVNAEGTYFSDEDNMVDFGCTILGKGVIAKPVKPTPKMLLQVFAGTSVKVENCKTGSAQIATDAHGIDKTQQEERTPDSRNDERQLIITALNTAGGDITKTAKKLKVTEKALIRKIKEHGIQMSAQ